MVFNAIHGVDEKDPSTVTAPFRFDRSIKLATLRIGVDANAPKELVAALKAIGVTPKEVGPRPTVAGIGGSGLSVEGAAAFDEYVQRKARETGLDLTTLPEPMAGRGGGGRGAGGGAGATAGSPGAAPANPMAPADWNPRFVNGRTTRAFDYVQAQRRRYLLVTKWAEYMRDLDMFVGNPQGDVGANAQTGHPCVVVPYKFDVPQQGGGRGGAQAQPPLELKPQPIGAVIVGNLFADDLILSVAHHLQVRSDVHLNHPAI
jgi:hypothetical protein